MKFQYLPLPALLMLAGCGSQSTVSSEPPTLTEARNGFQTKLKPSQDEKEPVENPPTSLFKVVQYDAPLGKFAAYITPNPGDDKKHPAIIWIHGGVSNSIGNIWSPRRQSNEQSASAYRKAGIVMMVPSLRGGNTNPGQREGFLGEVDDILAAADFLAKQSYVDPKRIYLGGHSTGGTLAMLVAESSDRFRGVFAFGPVDDVSGYSPHYGFVPADMSDAQEVKLRSPGYWLPSIQSPTWVIEGTSGSSNIDSLRAMAKSSQNAKAHFIEVKNVDHFQVLGPANTVIAKKIVADSGTNNTFELTAEEVNAAFKK